ncbi:hypothetical protein Q7P37_000251 [Cladosporium fusiforme]
MLRLVSQTTLVSSALIGIAKTLVHLGKLLQPPSQNRHAVLTTLFINAVEEMHLQEQHGATFASELKRVTQYLPLRTIPRSEGDPSTVMMMAALPMVREGDRFFDRYMEILDFREAGRMTGMRMKASNSTVAKWPMKLRLGPGDPDSGKEFKSMLASEHTGTERYCEWIRTSE